MQPCCHRFTSAATRCQSHLSHQLEEMEQLGSLYRPGGLVFANEIGGIINPSNLRNRSFARLLKRAVFRPIHASTTSGTPALPCSSPATSIPKLSLKCLDTPP